MAAGGVREAFWLTYPSIHKDLIREESNGKEYSHIGQSVGDEGIGKIVDMLMDQAAVRVRFQGGPQCRPHLVIDGQKTVLRLIPSGILHAHAQCLIGNGVELSPTALLQEIDELEGRGVPASSVCVSATLYPYPFLPCCAR